MGPNTTIKIINIREIPKRDSFRSDFRQERRSRPFQNSLLTFNLRAEKNERLLPCHHEQRKNLTSREQIAGLLNRLFSHAWFSISKEIVWPAFTKNFLFHSQSNLIAKQVFK